MKADLPLLAPAISRRAFLATGLAAGGGLLIGVALGGLPSMALAAAQGDAQFEPNAFVLLAPDGVVTVTMPYIEMGQGTYTSIPMLIAEELEIGLDQVRLRHAPASDQLYANPLLGFQITGGSTTIRGAFLPLRKAGAAARLMLVDAAAARWQVDKEQCYAERGQVIHRPTARRLGYGALAADAARLPLPATVALKPPAQFRLIGSAAKRLDSPLKVNGAAQYGIDAQVPGMKFAALAQSPVYGGKLRSVDTGPALRVKGVRQVLQLDDCVAVIADHTGAANKGLAALRIEWDDGPHAGLHTGAVRAALAGASVTGQAAVVRRTGDTKAASVDAAMRVEASYEQPFLIHAAMEPMNCTVHVRPDGCEVWVGTQVMSRAQASAAAVTGLPLDKVVVHNHYLGGSFGRRLEVDGVTRAVQIAAKVNFPVKVIWSREEDVQHDMYRGAFHDRLSAALTAGACRYPGHIASPARRP
jgi:CO/xanthine dehydrogenase Mo-binding subunit